MAININLPSVTQSYTNLASFPSTGNVAILYKALNNNKLYTWDGTKYNEVDKRFASSWGSISAAPTTTSVTKDEVGLGNVDNTADLDKPISTATQTALNLKVDKVAGKGLSTNDYTNTEKTKLTGIADGAEVNVNADWNATSGDAQILNKPTIPSTAGLATTTYVDTQDATKQATLVSGTNIKTINGSSVLGSGDLVVSGGGSGLQGAQIQFNNNGGNPTIFGFNAALIASNTGTAVPTSGRLDVYPVTPNRTLTNVSLTINVATLGVGSLARIVVYSNSNSFPTTKLYESTDIDCSTIGDKTVLSGLTFTAGTTYWLGFYSNGIATFRTISVGAMLPIFWSSLSTAVVGWSRINTTLGTAPTTFNYNTYTSTNVVNILIRQV